MLKIYSTVKRAVKRWLLCTLQPCREMVSLMSESMERRLTVGEFFKLRLHLLACAWCARYLRQIKFLRSLLRGQRGTKTELVPALAADARDRIAQSLNGWIHKS